MSNEVRILKGFLRSLFILMLGIAAVSFCSADVEYSREKRYGTVSLSVKELLALAESAIAGQNNSSTQ